MRAVLRAAVTGLTVGAVGLGAAWGAAVVSTPGLPTPPPAVADLTRGAGAPAAGSTVGGVAAAAAVVPGVRLPAGWFLAGSATTTLVPPADRVKSKAECQAAAGQSTVYTPLTPEGCLITFDGLWMDGVDAANPIAARSIALSNGKDTAVFTVLDLVGYMTAYPADLCADCGIDPVRKALSQELGIPAQNMQISSSHTHAAPSTIAKGGAWYYAFVRDQIKASIRGAVAGLAASPQVRLETGTATAKAFNVDRRIANRAVPDFGAAWLRAFVPGTTTTIDRPGKRDDTTTTTPDRTVATFGNFSVHPTVRNANARLHSGVVGPFTRRISEVLGGDALFMPAGLGDQTPDKSYGINGLGIGLADAVLADIQRGGYVLQSNDIEVAATTVQIPVENTFFLGALGTGYAVRDFLPPYGGGPYAVATTNSGSNLPVCKGAGSTHVVSPISAIRFGVRPPPGKRDIGPEYRLPVTTDNVVMVQTPGEIFASISLIAKDYLSRSNNVLVQGVTNDTLGYIIPANQYDETSSQGAGLAHNAAETGNYEEGLSLGRCTGEIVTNALLEMGAQLGVMGEGEAP